MTSARDTRLLNAALSAISHTPFISHEEYQQKKYLPEYTRTEFQEVDVDSFHQSSLVGGIVFKTANVKKTDSTISDIVVKGFNGVETRYSLDLGRVTLEELKCTIQNQEGISMDQLHLIMTCSPYTTPRSLLRNRQSLAENGVIPQSTIRVALLDEEHKLTQIFVKNIDGTTHVFQANLDEWEIGDFKFMIYKRLRIPPELQRLIFCGQQLEDDFTLSDYGVQFDSTLHLSLRLRGGGKVINFLNSDALDHMYDYDFTNVKDKGRIYLRGGLPYRRPCGWRRFALKVAGKYDEGDNTWLGVDNQAWPVSYHGTGRHNGRTMAEDGYLLSQERAVTFERGVYSTPDIEVAKLYAEEFEFEGEMYIIVIQNRVNPTNLEKIQVGTNGAGDFWISKNGKDVRPYGICIRRKEGVE